MRNTCVILMCNVGNGSKRLNISSKTHCWLYLKTTMIPRRMFGVYVKNKRSPSQL